MSDIRKNKILVVDDNRNWLNTISMILEPDYDVTPVADHEQAIKILKAFPFDLVILDKQLLGASGLEIFKQMRRIVPGIRAIMLTGFADVDSAVEIMKIGALDYIDKGTPDLDAELRLRVEEALKKSAAHAPGGAAEDTAGRGIMAMIAGGESSEVEFKSSARWDFRENRINKELERVIVKTVAAFLNSERGGTLLIGVDDDGLVVGLKHDYKTLAKRPNKDGYETYLTTLLLEAFGKDCSPLIIITFSKVGDDEVCQVDVKPSPRPQFVKDDKGEHLFIRTGNSTRPLSTREAVEYCRRRWN